MKKRILSLVLAVTSACTMIAISSVYAAGWDNNGRRWNYMNGASSYLSKSDFTFSYSTVNGPKKILLG